MFEFFQEAYLESKGVDMVSAQKQRKEKYRLSRLSYFLFSPKTKILVYVFGALYVAFAVYGMYGALHGDSDTAALRVLRYALLIAVDLFVCVCLAVSKYQMDGIVVERKKDIPLFVKRIEIAAACGIVVFIAVIMLSAITLPLL